jgi:hypothetical protein
MPVKTHELKTDSFVFDSVVMGYKTYEIRKNDRDFTVGESVLLKETKYTGEEMKSGAPLVYTGREFKALITHLLQGPVYGLQEGWAILSIKPL